MPAATKSAFDRPKSWSEDAPRLVDVATGRQPADLVEEVMRLEGLDVIPSVLPTAPAGRGLTPTQKRRRAIGKSLALNGFVEILPTPFLPAGIFDKWGLTGDDPRRRTTAVLNPLESDRPHLATTLLPGLLEALGRNVSRGAVDTALFAIAQVVEPTSETRAVERIPNDRRPTDEEIAYLDASLPRQPQHVGAVLTGLREPAGPWGPGRQVQAADAFEAVRVIGRAAGVELDTVHASFPTLIPGLTSGRYDMLFSSFGNTVEREKVMDFINYRETGTFLITRKGNPAELDSNDLCGEKIAVVGGSTQVELVVPALDKACESEGKPPIETIRFPESSDAPAAVASGRADGALIPSPQALYLASIQPDNFEVPDFVHLGQSYSGMTVPKGSDLVAPLEAALNALIESGVYGEILEKWNMSALAVPNAIINGASERQ